jgi:hypothetical protein
MVQSAVKGARYRDMLKKALLLSSMPYIVRIEF